MTLLDSPGELGAKSVALATDLSTRTAPAWVDVCPFEELVPDRGVAALVGQWQVAVFRVAPDDGLYAIANHDPFSRANVLSRGIVGSRNGVAKVASPMYKQSFDLLTGVCLDDPSVSVPVFPVRIEAGMVQVAGSVVPTGLGTQ